MNKSARYVTVESPDQVSTSACLESDCPLQCSKRSRDPKSSRRAKNAVCRNSPLSASNSKHTMEQVSVPTAFRGASVAGDKDPSLGTGEASAEVSGHIPKRLSPAAAVTVNRTRQIPETASAEALSALLQLRDLAIEKTKRESPFSEGKKEESPSPEEGKERNSSEDSDHWCDHESDSSGDYDSDESAFWDKLEQRFPNNQCDSSNDSILVGPVSESEQKEFDNNAGVYASHSRRRIMLVLTLC